MGKTERLQHQYEPAKKSTADPDVEAVGTPRSARRNGERWMKERTEKPEPRAAGSTLTKSYPQRGHQNSSRAPKGRSYATAPTRTVNSCGHRPRLSREEQGREAPLGDDGELPRRARQHGRA